MNTRTTRKPSFWMLFAFVLVLTLTIASPSFAQEDVTGTVSVTAGSLSMTAADTLTFAATQLNGTTQTPSNTAAIDVSDFTGSGAGWKLQITSTAFKDTGSNVLPNTAMTITGVNTACDGTTCTDPTNVIGYPFTVPADTAAPAAGTFFSSAVNTGMGDFTVTPTFQLSIPATTFVADYSSTVTITIASAP